MLCYVTVQHWRMIAQTGLLLLEHPIQTFYVQLLVFSLLSWNDSLSFSSPSDSDILSAINF